MVGNDLSLNYFESIGQKHLPRQWFPRGNSFKPHPAFLYGFYSSPVFPRLGFCSIGG